MQGEEAVSAGGWDSPREESSPQYWVRKPFPRKLIQEQFDLTSQHGGLRALN